MLEAHPRRPRARRAAALVAGNAAVLAGLLLALELAGAWLDETPAGAIVDSWRFHHTWRPGGTSLHREWAAANPEFPTPYRHVYNAQGWIERYDVSPEKPPDTVRVFYVGDSFVEGTVPMEESLPSLVESRLAELARGSGLRFEVINTGTSSYSPTLFYVLTRHRILDYAPDLIVAHVDMTDDFDEWKYRQTALTDDEGNPSAVPPRSAYLGDWVDTPGGAVPATFGMRVQLFLYRHSHFYRALLSRRATPESPGAARARGGLYPRWGWCAGTWDATTRQVVEGLCDVLRRLAALCRENGVKLALTSVPHYPQYASGPDGTGPPLWSARPHRRIARLAREIGVPYLDSFGALAPSVRGTPHEAYYYRGDMHMNPRGYRVWARAQLEFLIDPGNGLLPPAFYAGVARARP